MWFLSFTAAAAKLVIQSFCPCALSVAASQLISTALFAALAPKCTFDFLQSKAAFCG